MSSNHLYGQKKRLLESRVAQCSVTEKMLQNLNNGPFIRNQQESPLLRLPAEIRNQIYTLVFRVLPPILICFATSHATRPLDTCPFARSQWRQWSHMHYSRLRLWLTEVCRQTYAETRLLPFALNTFIGYPEAVLAAFPGRLDSAQLASITTVHLMVQSRDVGGDENGHVRTKRVYLSWDVCSALRVLRMLPGLNGLRVVWDGEPLHKDVWGRFQKELATKAVGQSLIEQGQV